MGMEVLAGCFYRPPETFISFSFMAGELDPPSRRTSLDSPSTFLRNSKTVVPTIVFFTGWTTSPSSM